MSTAELKQIIDQRTPEARKWMTAHLLDEMFSVPELAKRRRSCRSSHAAAVIYWLGDLESRKEEPLAAASADSRRKRG